VTATGARSEEVLREEILSGARRQAEERLSRAKADAEVLLQKSRADAEKERGEKLVAAKTAATMAADQTLGRLPVDIGRMKSARIESLLSSVRDEVARRLQAREGFDYREALVSLAVKAIGRMVGTRFVVSASEADRKVLDNVWKEDVKRRAGREGLQLEVAPEPARISGGLIVRDAEGRQLSDESFEARLDRLWPAARRQIAVQSGLISSVGVREEK
jgi:vacuolar-type H+-ATPase subunit E/Vma4